MSNFFRSIDLFGRKIELSVNGKSTIRSPYGGVLTVAMIITLIALAYFIGSDIFYRQHPSSYTQTLIETKYQNVTITAESFPLSFFVGNYASEDAYDEDYLDVQIIYKEFKMGSNGLIAPAKLTQLALERCTRANYPTLSDKEYKQSLLHLSFCVNGNYSLWGYWNEDSMNYFSVILKLCNKTTNPNCKDDNEIFDYIAQQKIAFVYNIIATQTVMNNYTHPLKRYKTIPYLWAGKFFKQGEFNIQQDSIETDNGLIFENWVSTPFLSLYVNGIDFSDYSDTDKMLISMDFNSSPRTTKHYRSYIKIPNILALTGGIIKIVMIVFEFINKPICLIEKYLTIINEMYKESSVRRNDGKKKENHALELSCTPIIGNNHSSNFNNLKATPGKIIELSNEINQLNNNNTNLKIKNFPVTPLQNKVNPTNEPIIMKKENNINHLKGFTKRKEVPGHSKSKGSNYLSLGIVEFIIILWRQVFSSKQQSTNELVNKYEDGKNEISIYFEYIYIINKLKDFEHTYSPFDHNELLKDNL